MSDWTGCVGWGSCSDPVSALLTLLSTPIKYLNTENEPEKHAVENTTIENDDVTSDYEEYWDIRFCSAVMEVDTANNNHADRDDNSDTTGDSAADSTEEEQDNFDYKVNHIS